MAKTGADWDAVIIGGGFYGCCLALFLASVSRRVLVVESGERVMERASRVNQARIHTGFHYPRSFTTALRSRVLQERFVRDFKHAVVDDFDMLYAIASRRSKVSASRFARMFEAADAPFRIAPRTMRALFSHLLIDEVFLCREFAFDWQKLRDELVERMTRHGIETNLNETVESARQDGERVIVSLASGREVTAGFVFNVTYAHLNRLTLTSGLMPLALKHELAEVALVEPPEELRRLAVTVMDGPFFSTMPYPSEHLYSLTHVRYTPHYSWIDSAENPSSYAVAAALPQLSRWRHMVQDAKRYLPCLDGARYVKSIFDVKTLLLKNERDDGRPILLHRHVESPLIFSIMGAKIDNIYDLFDVLPQLDSRWRDAHPGLVCGG